MLRVCENSDTSLWSGYEISSEENRDLFLKVNDLKSSDVKEIIEAVSKILSNFDDGEYIALNAVGFFETISEASNGDLYEYIVDYDDYASFQFIEYFEKPEEYDNDDDDDNEDYDDEYDYDSYIDVDSIFDISDSYTENYMVRFIKENDTISIEISNDINMIDMTLAEFLSLYK